MRHVRFFLPVIFCLIARLSAAQKDNTVQTAGSAFSVAAEKGPKAWPSVLLVPPRLVELQGYLGGSLERGIKRLGRPPYSADWLLSDVSFKVNRIFNNYSGDVSGRFLELGILTSSPGNLSPATLPDVIGSVVNYQKPDGHFGVEIDLDKPLVRNSAPVTLLWGNARMLVGLITAARNTNDQRLLESARKLGDFYVNTAHQLCSPAREAEYRATGTAADSYVCCYFPAMEGLVMLYRETKDKRYLQQAVRMAGFFQRFDTLPIDHSHGNLSSWRSILELYNLTGDRNYLNKAEAKWAAAVGGGFVWPLGGVGEHWYVSFNGDEGCSESDWLRFNLDLWRFTGKTYYLDMAERLLKNQYISNQTPNGGYGMRRLDSGPTGPVATGGVVNEWDFCCSFHGPLGLYFLKSYLAAASGENIYINFPLDYTSRVKAGDTEWKVGVSTVSGGTTGSEKVRIEIEPVGAPSKRPVTVWLRVPYWASGVNIDGAPSSPAGIRNGYVALKNGLKSTATLTATFTGRLTIEGRRFTAIKPKPGNIFRMEDVSLVQGPNLLFETPARGPGRSKLLVTMDDEGKLELLRNTDGSFSTVNLTGAANTGAQILAALDTCSKVALMPWPLTTTRRSAFVYDLVVVPAGIITPAVRAGFAARLPQAQVPHYGTNLEKQAGLWPVMMPWTFGPEGISIKGGDIGLLEGSGYKDYRFEFNLKMPVEGRGITGWVVRAKDENNCIMFQIQSSDTQYNAPRFKTKANSLRTLIRSNGEWTILDPVSLPVTVKKGEIHHIATECAGNSVSVYIDGQKIHEYNDHTFPRGTIGFRVKESFEEALVTNISLKEIQASNNH